MKKILIANRGEIACRIIHSCVKSGIQSVAVYSEIDKQAMHVALANEAYCIGPAKASESYLCTDKIIKTAKISAADAIHPGYGFLAENADFSRQVKAAGLCWIGPEPDCIDSMGDKQRARTIAMQAGVPVLPGSQRFTINKLKGIEQAAAKQVGYPLLVKASAGGGGIGMRLVESADKLLTIVQSTQTMAVSAFGDGAIFLEHYVQKARHIEVQIFGFGDGRVIHLYERECSMQRRFQKVIEESPAPKLSDKLRNEIAKAAVKLASIQKYSGAGTVEFILDANTMKFYFLEMNTRIQVEHPVTEMTTDIDLVDLQIRHSFAEDLNHINQESIIQRGHAIECRIYAEDPVRRFLPTPGTLQTFRIAADQPGLRLDTGVRQGDKISAYYDPLIAKLIAYGNDRQHAIERMSKALNASEIADISHNLHFLSNCMAHPAFTKGNIYTGFIESRREELTQV